MRCFGVVVVAVVVLIGVLVGVGVEEEEGEVGEDGGGVNVARDRARGRGRCCGVRYFSAVEMSVVDGEEEEGEGALGCGSRPVVVVVVVVVVVLAGDLADVEDEDEDLSAAVLCLVLGGCCGVGGDMHACMRMLSLVMEGFLLWGGVYGSVKSGSVAVVASLFFLLVAAFFGGGWLACFVAAGWGLLVDFPGPSLAQCWWQPLRFVVNRMHAFRAIVGRPHLCFPVTGASAPNGALAPVIMSAVQLRHKRTSLGFLEHHLH